MSQSSPSTLWQTIPDDQLVRQLLDRSHTLNGAVLLGLEGLMIEIQARAMNVDEGGLSWRKAVKISGMAKGAVGEALDRISGAFRATGIPDPKVAILINLTPPDVPKDGTSARPAAGHHHAPGRGLPARSARP